MRPSNKMQKTIERIAKINGVDLASAQVGTVYLKIESSGFMDLVIEKPYPNTISVAHYYRQNGDSIQDPEMLFLIGCLGRWYPYSIQHPPPFNHPQVLVTFEDDDMERGTYHSYYPKGQHDAAAFGNKWADNIRRQGFVKKQDPVEQVQIDQVSLW